MLPRLALGLLLAVAGALCLSACGVRGNLDAPPEAKNESDAGVPSRPGEPKRGFILDPLLR